MSILRTADRRVTVIASVSSFIRQRQCAVSEQPSPTCCAGNHVGDPVQVDVLLLHQLACGSTVTRRRIHQFALTFPSRPRILFVSAWPFHSSLLWPFVKLLVDPGNDGAGKRHAEEFLGIGI